MLDVYIINYKYLKFSGLLFFFFKGVDISVDKKMTCLIFESCSQDRLMYSLCWLENKWVCEHGVGVGFVPQSLTVQ